MAEAERDYYELLGVGRDATADELKKAFRKLARQVHPDVAKGDPDAHDRFSEVRRAYETLSDPQQRAIYDLRYKKRRASHGPGPGWRPPGGHSFGDKKPPEPNTRAWKTKQNNLNLDDIFGEGNKDFGFGVGAGDRTSRARANADQGEAGTDITVHVDVPAKIARHGGLIPLHYPRLVRGETSDELVRYDEIHDLRVPPGIAEGNVLRIPRLGNAGAKGGRYGDLVCHIHVVAQAEPPPPDAPRRAGPSGGPRSQADAEATHGAAENGVTVPIGVAEALLGGRVEVETPGGRVRVTVPPCTSSGAKLRLKGKGAGGKDLTVTLQIVVPTELDDESRELVRRFALLNPKSPRE